MNKFIHFAQITIQNFLYSQLLATKFGLRWVHQKNCNHANI